MKCSKIDINNFFFYIAKDDIGVTFIGCKNGNKEEIYKWFKDVIFIEDNAFKNEAKELGEYFLKKRTHFSFSYHLIGTPFMIKVLNEVKNISYGGTATYKDIALSLGNVNLTRAVSQAIARNPLLIIIPCHRIIGTDGKLRGYRSGLDFKKELLELES